MKTPKILLFFVSLLLSTAAAAQETWPVDKANDWYRQQPWMTGANFSPSTAVNQLEMWQAATFDTATIRRELGYAAAIGFNTMRVYLHHVAWQEDAIGFKERIKTYLSIAGENGIKTIFVFFDDCWSDHYRPGPQPAPIPSVHNSRWLKDPGSAIDDNPALMDTLQWYVKDILTTFKDNIYVSMWDLYNEPGHFGHGDKSWPLLKNVVAWAREIRPSQPITIGIWNDGFTAFNQYQLENSDVITFHNYRDTTSLITAIDTLTHYGKPVICTEYMKRPNNSTFVTHLPIFKRNRVGAINWGLVAGKTQTNYPQGNKGGEPEPVLWYHDIFRNDGTPFSPEEIVFIRKMNQ
ncbi:1,4-beta-xylanase [Chitinophaga sp. 30R24]|uniref:1,4-beta-xylanase n=1 Tax=Chitinophaga sp. 30R24 TaxID=3248838 RepID=UPI003B913C71